jgi:pyridoxal phosphate enzyme (YggS family)
MARALARAGRAPDGATLVAVTKSVDASVARELWELGQHDLAENRVQELERKARALPAETRWHLVGPIQSNKARKVVALARVLHAVDRAELIPKLDNLAAEAGVKVTGFLEVNVSGEESKHGVKPEEALAVLESARRRTHLALEGLMTMAPLAAAEPEARRIFRRLRELRDRAAGAGLFEGPGALSMGLAGDFETALEEGSTHVRIGTALFEDLTSVKGPR